MRFRSILVYLDTRTAADAAHLPRALEDIARFSLANDASLLLCDVVEVPPGERGAGPAARLGELRQRYARNVLDRLAGALGRLVESNCIVLQGHPFLELTRFAAHRGIDLVVVPDLGDTHTRQAAIAAHLVRKCPAAVWQYRTRGAARQGGLAVALDRELFATSDTPRTMASRLLDAALALARRQPVPAVSLVHAWQVYGAELLDDPSSGLAAEESARYVDSQRYSHTLWLEEMHAALRDRAVAAGLQALETTTVLLEGAPDVVIADWLARADIDTLILGNTGTSAAPGLFIGSTAEAILSHCGQSVLTVKAQDFRSPVLSR